MPDDDSPDPADRSIEELAREADIPVSTVRMYQNRGVLPPPVRRGRRGVYGDEHAARLRLIAHLQDRGFSLAAIKESIESWEAGRSLDHLLGVGDVVPSLTRQPVRFSPAEMAECFENVEITPADMLRAAEIGLVTIDDDTIVLSNAAFTEIGPAVAAVGVPVSEILDEYEALTEAVAQIAERFRSVFERNIWDAFVAEGMPADRLPDLADDVLKLTALATAVVTNELHDKFAEFADEFLARAVEEQP